MKWPAAAALVTCLGFASMAQAVDASQAAAISAFDEGQELLDAGQTAAACKKFGASYRLDPQLGSLLHWANCLEKNNQLASAWAAFSDAAGIAETKGDEREDLARARSLALKPRLSFLLLRSRNTLPSGTEVRRAGELIPEAAWNTSVPVDQGTYVIEVTAPGYEPFQISAQVGREGVTAVIDIPELTPIASAPPVHAASDDGVREKGPSLVSRKWPAFLAAAVGVAGAVVGGVSSAQSLSAKSQADELCGPSSPSCLSNGNDLRQQAWDAGNVATIGAVVGGVGLAAAVTLWIALPGASASDTSKSAGAATSHGGVALGLRPLGAVIQGSF